jgi:hypothetical protein
MNPTTISTHDDSLIDSPYAWTRLVVCVLL